MEGDQMQGVDEFLKDNTVPFQVIPQPLPGEQPQPQEEPKKVFKPLVDGQLPGQEPAEPVQIKGPDTDVKLDVFLNAKNILTAEMLKYLAKADSSKAYMLGDEELEMLAQVYAPYLEAYGGKVPGWIWLIVVESLTTGKKVMQAINDRKINTANEQGRSNPSVKKTIANAKGPERRYWKIDVNGYYTFGPTGGYLKQGERIEKAKVDDLENLLTKNTPELLMQVFGLTKEDLKEYLPEDNE